MRTDIGAIRDERLLLVDRLRGLPDDAWDRPSLCAGWTVRHVLAHLVTPFTVSAPSMAVAVARHRSIDRAMDAAARRIAEDREPDDLLSVLEDHASSAFHPPGLPLAAALTDAVVHSADIRWGLGDPRGDWGAPGRLAPVLDFLTSRRAGAGFVPPGRLRGLALRADDIAWERGVGAEVRGPALVLAMGILGREQAFPGLTGDGVTWLAR